jgi:hypothetical protein
VRNIADTNEAGATKARCRSHGIVTGYRFAESINRSRAVIDEWDGFMHN